MNSEIKEGDILISREPHSCVVKFVVGNVLAVDTQVYENMITSIVGGADKN